MSSTIFNRQRSEVPQVGMSYTNSNKFVPAIIIRSQGFPKGVSRGLCNTGISKNGNYNTINTKT